MKTEGTSYSCCRLHWWTSRKASSSRLADSTSVQAVIGIQYKRLLAFITSGYWHSVQAVISVQYKRLLPFSTNGYCHSVQAVIAIQYKRLSAFITSGYCPSGFHYKRLLAFVTSGYWYSLQVVIGIRYKWLLAFLTSRHCQSLQADYCHNYKRVLPLPFITSGYCHYHSLQAGIAITIH